MIFLLSAIAIFALTQLKESFNKDLNYLEEWRIENEEWRMKNEEWRSISTNFLIIHQFKVGNNNLIILREGGIARLLRLTNRYLPATCQ
jgi:hypothetical protein